MGGQWRVLSSGCESGLAAWVERLMAARGMATAAHWQCRGGRVCRGARTCLCGLQFDFVVLGNAADGRVMRAW